MRALDLLHDIGRRYPKAWAQAAFFREEQDWPDWCYLPLGGWYAIVSDERADGGQLGLGEVGDVAILGALGTWRMTQGVYRFDEDLAAALYDTQLDSDLPSEVLYQLPQWCVYIETPGRTCFGVPLHGFFAHMEHDANTGRPELRLLLDFDGRQVAVVLHIGKWPLAEAVRRAHAESDRQARAWGGFIVDPTAQAQITLDAAPLVSLVLYLCAQNAEIGSGARPANPLPRKTKRGLRLFQAAGPTTWDVGVRMGAALRAARAASDDGGVQGDGTHARPRAHIRRAHWHGFRSGPIKRQDGSVIPTEERRFDIRWLPPIAVNVDADGEIPVTIHPVSPEND